MSEYKPITGELRGEMCHSDTFYGTGKVEMDESYFARLCYAIDAVHAQLEKENDELRAKLIDANQKSIRLEREVAELDAGLRRVIDGQEGLTEPYKDVDGEYIRVGDTMMWSDGTTFEVVGIGDGTLYYVETDAEGNTSIEWTSVEQKRHYHPDTWERIIEDAVNVHGSGFNPGWADERDSLVARCRALCKCIKGGDAE